MIIPLTPRSGAWLLFATLILPVPAAGQMALAPACESLATPDDSAREAVRDAIRATLLTAAAAAGVPDPQGLVVVMVNRDGTDPVFRMVAGNLTGGALAVAAPYVAGLAAAWPGEGRVRLLVRLDPLPMPQCRPGRPRRATDPRFVRPDEGSELLCQLARRHADHRVGLGQVVLWVALSRAGEVVYSEVETGQGELVPQHSLLTDMAALQMRPATLDGTPQDMIFATQLLTRVRPEGRAPQRQSERLAGGAPSPLWDVSRDPSGCDR